MASINKENNRTRRKYVKYSTKEEREAAKREQERRRGQSRIYLNTHISTWLSMKEKHGWENDGITAKHLLECYEQYGHLMNISASDDHDVPFLVNIGSQKDRWMSTKEQNKLSSDEDMTCFLLNFNDQVKQSHEVENEFQDHRESLIIPRSTSNLFTSKRVNSAVEEHHSKDAGVCPQQLEVIKTERSGDVILGHDVINSQHFADVCPQQHDVIKTEPYNNVVLDHDVIDPVQNDADTTCMWMECESVVDEQFISTVTDLTSENIADKRIHDDDLPRMREKPSSLRVTETDNSPNMLPKYQSDHEYGLNPEYIDGPDARRPVDGDIADPCVITESESTDDSDFDYSCFLSDISKDDSEDETPETSSGRPRRKAASVALKRARSLIPFFEDEEKPKKINPDKDFFPGKSRDGADVESDNSETEKSGNSESEDALGDYECGLDDGVRQQCTLKNNKPEKCHICDYQTMHTMLLHQHIYDKHGIIPEGAELLTCDVCPFTYVHDTKLAHHHKECHPDIERLVLCQDCRQKFSNQSLPVHRKMCAVRQKKLEEKNICHICGRKSRIVLSYYQHMYDKHDIVPEGAVLLSCNLCSFTSFNDVKDAQHYRKCHPGTEGLVQCQDCDQMFVRRYLGIHRQRMHGLVGKCQDNPFICESCGKTYAAKRDLNRHILRFHEMSTAPIIDCPVVGCKKQLKSGFPMQTHIRLRHTNRRKVNCSFAGCKKTFSGYNNMRVHMKQHTGVKSFACVLCDYSAIQKICLKLHMKNKHPDCAIKDIHISS